MSQRNAPRQITVADMSPHVHSFLPGENKVNKIAQWLIKWIEQSLKSGKIKPLDLLPAKGDLAFHIGVSQGTIQNAFRYVEDCGYLESKQRIGTYIKGVENKTVKLTSKRELAADAIKRYLAENDYAIGDCLISTRKLSKIIGISGTTIRMAINSLITENVLKKENNVFVINKINYDYEEVKKQTLVEKTAASLKKYISKNLRPGDRLPSNNELTSIFNVSVKTIHDAVKLLIKDGILYSMRGRYGTVVVDKSNKNTQYDYEKIEQKIRYYIYKKAEIGTKLPSMSDFASEYNVSVKTVKKALDNLAEEGFIAFTRGRYGGTFVTDIPQGVKEAYKWLALSREYSSNIEN